MEAVANHLHGSGRALRPRSFSKDLDKPWPSAHRRASRTVSLAASPVTNMMASAATLPCLRRLRSSERDFGGMPEQILPHRIAAAPSRPMPAGSPCPTKSSPSSLPVETSCQSDPDIACVLTCTGSSARQAGESTLYICTPRTVLRCCNARSQRSATKASQHTYALSTRRPPAASCKERISSCDAWQRHTRA
jgi:hypothetical protein